MKKLIVLFSLVFALTGCTYNPFSSNNHTTGSGTGAIIGTVGGAGAAALLHFPKPLIFLAGIGGGAFGYYATTLRFAAGGIIQGGGQVYTVGDYIGISISTDRLFEVNTADFLPSAYPILDSVAATLARYPNHNILISGNTSGFSRPRWERKLSQARAQKISAYLWKAGIGQFKENSNQLRRLNYVGDGNYFPIANDWTNKGIRENSRIQITAYPANCKLHEQNGPFSNIGSDDDGIEYQDHACDANCIC